MGGGEPTMQHEFVAELLRRAKQQYIQTAIETCGYVKWEYLENIYTMKILKKPNRKNYRQNKPIKMYSQRVLSNAR